MKLIHLFLFSVCAGVAFGKKLECLEKEISGCATSLQLKWALKPETNQCVKLGQAADCLESAATKCKDEAQKAMKDLVDLARDLCNPKSQMNQDLRNYGLCLQNKEFQGKFIQVCMAEYSEQVMDLVNQDKTNLEAFTQKVREFICPNRENILNCGYGQIKSQCSEPAEKFFRKVFGPFDELLKESCDSASIPSISMALIFLQLFIAIFSLRKIL